MNRKNHYEMPLRMITMCLAFFILFSIASCSVCGRESTGQDDIISRECDYFETRQFIPDYPASDTSLYFCSDVSAKEEETAILIGFSDSEDLIETDSVVFCVNDAGQQTRSFSLQSVKSDFTGSSLHYLQDGRLAVFGFSEESGFMILVLSLSGDAYEEMILLPSLKGYIVDFLEDKDQWIFLSNESFIVTDMRGTPVFEKDLTGELIQDDLFLLSDKPSAWVLVEGIQEITSLDLTNKSISETSMNGFSRQSEIQFFEKRGAYIIAGDGVYRLDLQTKKWMEIASWNAIDIPPSQSVENITENHVLNDDVIVRAIKTPNSYRSDEIYLLFHRDINPNAGKKILTIGGYGVRQEDAIRYAVYLYNTGDYGYRIELVDYYEKYPFEDNASMSRAYLNIGKDMSEGKGDDILTGAFFDFNTLGKSGTVIDMYEMAKNDPEFDTDSILPNILRLLMSSGKLYQIMPSFTMQGFVSYSDLIETSKPLTIQQVKEVSGHLGEGQYMLVNSWRINLAILSVQYRLEDFLTDDGDFTITQEELTSILEYADTFGMPDDYSGQPPINDVNTAYITGKLILMDGFISSPYEYNRCEQLGTRPMTFMGIPSVYNSARVCSSRDLLAISAASDNPEACWDFIKLLFSEEAQRRATLEDCIPVSTIVFEEQIQKAMKPDLMTEDDNLSAMFSNAPKPMSEETAARYRDCVNSLNAMNCYNIEIGNILWEEFNSYYYEGKPIDAVRDTLINRINLYLDEKDR